MKSELIQVSPHKIAPSLTNPRKTFDQAKLAELAESIRASGVHQPVLVRPLPASRLQDTFRSRAEGNPLPDYELVAGERRLRASIMAEQELIPAIWRELTDAQALEIQVIENLQRDDLSALEEAEGYETLMNCGGDGERLTADQVAAKIGKSRSYVYARLKLLDLCQEAREALRNGDLDASKALMIARVPTHKLQLRAVAELAKKDHLGETMGARAAAAWLRHNLMLKLDTAPFDITDATLIAEAGACASCPKRTGANPELFEDVGSADVCTDTTCFHDKKQAHTDRIIEKARNKGMKVIEGVEAKKAVPYQSADWIVGYSDVDQIVQGGRDGSASLRDLATEQELRDHLQLLVDPHNGGTREVIAQDVATTIIARAIDAQPKTKAQEKLDALDIERNLERQRAELADAYHSAWRHKAHEAVSARLHEVDRFDANMLRAVLFYAAGCGYRSPDADKLEQLLTSNEATQLDWDDAEEAMQVLAKADDLALGPVLLQWLIDYEKEPLWRWNNGAKEYQLIAPMLDALANYLGINLDEIRTEVQVDMHAEFSALARKEEAAKSPPPLPPAAQAEIRGQGKAKKGGKGKKAAPEQTLLSAEEAMQGIAHAMQGEEVGGDCAPEDADQAGASAGGDEGRATSPDAGAAQLIPGARVRFVGDHMTDQLGRVVDSTESGDKWVVKVDGLESDFVFEADELEVLDEQGASA